MWTVTVQGSTYSLNNTCPTDTAWMEALALWRWEETCAKGEHSGILEARSTREHRETLQSVNQALSLLWAGEVAEARNIMYELAPRDKRPQYNFGTWEDASCPTRALWDKLLQAVRGSMAAASTPTLDMDTSECPNAKCPTNDMRADDRENPNYGKRARNRMSATSGTLFLTNRVLPTPTDDDPAEAPDARAFAEAHTHPRGFRLDLDFMLTRHADTGGNLTACQAHYPHTAGMTCATGRERTLKIRGEAHPRLWRVEWDTEETGAGALHHRMLEPTIQVNGRAMRLVAITLYRAMVAHYATDVLLPDTSDATQLSNRMPRATWHRYDGTVKGGEMQALGDRLETIERPPHFAITGLLYADLSMRDTQGQSRATRGREGAEVTECGQRAEQHTEENGHEGECCGREGVRRAAHTEPRPMQQENVQEMSTIGEAWESLQRMLESQPRGRKEHENGGDSKLAALERDRRQHEAGDMARQLKRLQKIGKRKLMERTTREDRKAKGPKGNDQAARDTGGGHKNYQQQGTADTTEPDHHNQKQHHQGLPSHTPSQSPPHLHPC